MVRFGFLFFNNLVVLDVLEEIDCKKVAICSNLVTALPLLHLSKRPHVWKTFLSTNLENEH